MLKGYGGATAACALLLVQSFASACAQPGLVRSGEVRADTLPIRVILKDALKREAPAFAGRIEQTPPAALRIVEERSAAVPGLVYHWTAYAPPATNHIVIFAVVGSFQGSVIQIRNPGDWNETVRKAGWRLTGLSAATAGCQELVRTTGARRNTVWPPAMITDLAVLAEPSVRGREQLLPRITTPSATRGEDGWRITAWFLEPGQTTKYQCHIRQNAPSEYSALEAISGAGFPELD